MKGAPRQRPILIMAGGTGGHVFPGLVVAQNCLTRGIPVVWLGTRRGLEARLVPAADIPIEWLDVSGLRGKGAIRFMLAPLMLGRALLQAARIVHRLRPCLTVGMGGFVSGPGGAIAWLLRVPLLIHEQNAVAGFTNQILARLARKVFQAFPDTFPASVEALTVGNPVRPAIAGLPTPQQRFAGRTGPIRLLVVGGSQGAAVLNQLLPEAVQRLPEDLPIVVRHQTGEREVEETELRYRSAEPGACVSAFIEDMADAYTWADIVVCRSGALTVSELAAAGLGSILIPFPHAVDDHQTVNARFLENAGAAVVVPQDSLDAEGLAQLLTRLCKGRSELLAMAVAARRVAITDAADRLLSEGLRHVRA